MALFDALSRLLRRSRRGSEADPTPEPDAISCEQAIRLVHDFLDGELEDVPSARVRRHFEVCQRCYPHLRLEESFRAALRGATSGERASPELRDRVLKVLEEAAAE